MRIRFVLPALAIAGAALTAVTVIQDDRSADAVPLATPIPKVPFNSYVAGTGIVEASTGNIAVGTPVSGIVVAIYVKTGDQVHTGDPLFKIDDRDQEGQLLLADAKVQEAKAELAKSENLYKIAQRLKVGSSIAEVDMANRRFDVDIKRAAVTSAAAQVKQIKIEIDRHTVKAPVSGRVFQINTRLGEFAQSGVVDPPLMVMGNDTHLRLRVNIDENEAWRVRAGARAYAYVRGNPSLGTALRFERFEPYVIPKTSLTGQSTERTDMRVLQVLYDFDRAALNVYVGQQMDAFIEAPPVPEPSHTAAAKP